MMIVSFRDQATEDLYRGNFTHRTARFPRSHPVGLTYVGPLCPGTGG